MPAEQPFVDPGDISLNCYVLGCYMQGCYVLGQAEAGDRIAVVDHSRGGQPRQWTYAALTTAVANVAAHLRAEGVAGGDVVAVLTENSAEFVIAYQGVLAAGAVVLPLDPRGREAEWRAEVSACGARAIIAEPALWPEPPALAQGAIDIGDVPAGDAPDLPVIRGGDRPAVLMSSSGTQGKPKKIIVTHRNLTAGLAQIETVHRVGDGEAVLCVGPLRHIYGMQMAMNLSLRARGTLVIGSIPFTPAEFLAQVRDNRVAVTYLVPSVIAELAALPTAPELPDLRLIVSGGAPLPACAARGCAAKLGVRVVQGYGMTEAGCVSFTPDDRRGPPGSIGVILPGTDARFVDPTTGTDVPDGEPGELWLRGPQIAAGLLDIPGKGGLQGRLSGVATDPDGWLRTGDLVVRDTDGFLRISGRLKSLIKYKGHQVCPAEIEEILLAHHAVTDALVVGQPDPVAGELPKAYVVLNDQVPLTDVVAHVAASVAPHKRIRLIERVREIPRSATGKAFRPPAVRVLVTGGGKGLGLEFAVNLAKAGASVLITGRDRAALEAAVVRIRGAGGRISSAVADVADKAAIDAAMRIADETFGGIDVLVNNAGVPGPLGPTWAVAEDEWWRAVEINLRGCESAARAVLPGMISRGCGRVINVVSRAGKLRWPYASAYAVSKAALIALTANLDGELRGTGVSTVAFDPGLLDVGMTRAHLERGHVGDAWADEILDWILRTRETGDFASLPAAIETLVGIATGAADHLSGRYVVAADLAATAERECIADTSCIGARHAGDERRVRLLG